MSQHLPSSRGSLSHELRDPESELIGTVVSTTDIVFAEQAAGPFDLVWIDLEHSALSIRDAQASVIAASAAGAFSLIRLPNLTADMVGPVLDTGVDGIVVPRVDTPDELTALAAALHFPPKGRRGYAPRRSALSGRTVDVDLRPACVLQVESTIAVANAADLARMDICDALVVGTSDLSFDLGVPADISDPRLDAAVVAVREAALAAGKGWGVAVGGSPTRMRELAATAGGCLIYSSDVRMFSEILAQVAGALASGTVGHELETGTTR
jgi:4-hydroxy-2-oxoheptanedioate aldolase